MHCPVPRSVWILHVEECLQVQSGCCFHSDWLWMSPVSGIPACGISIRCLIFLVAFPIIGEKTRRESLSMEPSA